MADSFDLGEPPQPAPATTPYRVLARKYRPQTFAALIGQDAVVQTLANAIARGRLAHAFLLTGVRGVGKTSTARLIAKALNCIGPHGQGGPTINPCGACEPCIAIAEGRHIDVIEMDAASHTGIDDVREITEAVRYAAVSARYKVYIIDEVHMLSKQAFNGLLKTLEEPPAHVKFLFATTEVNKVPVTVLSRCQRFDLRRIPAETLAGHFAEVVRAEAVVAEPEALALIARAAEGSARDGLSILDQAIAHGGGDVTAVQVRDMLGLSDRGAVRALLANLLAGDAARALAGFTALYDYGADPSGLIRGLLELVHAITRAKVGGPGDAAQSAEEREAVADWASRLGFPQLHRLWQLLLKGLDEVERAPMPLEAGEMALLRVVHASQLPDPGELARRLAGGEAMAGSAAPAAALPQAGPPSASPPLPATMLALVELVEGSPGGAHLGQQLRDYWGLVRLDGTSLEIKPLRPLSEPDAFLRALGELLRKITGQRWAIVAGNGPAEPSLLQQEQQRDTAEREAVLADPLVRAAFAAFPEAELVSYTTGEPRSAEDGNGH